MGAESPSFEPPDLRPTGSEKPEGMTTMAVGDTMGHPEAQEDKEQSGHMGGYEAAPMGHLGETPSPGVTAHLTLGSVRPYRHEPQRVPARGSEIAVAETESVLQDWLCSAYVPTSSSERVELCLPRSGAPAPAGDRRDDDDNDARTTHSRPLGVPGVCGGQPLASLQIPSDWGTQKEKTNEISGNSKKSATNSAIYEGELSQNWRYFVRLVYRQPGRNWRELELRELEFPELRQGRR